MRLNVRGEVSNWSLVVSNPQPLPSAAPAAAEAAAAPRQAARPWPGFRGPQASGIGDGQGAPATWSLATRENVRFKTPLPGLAVSSPIVWGDAVFVTSAVSASGDKTFRTGLYGDGTSVDDLSEHSFRLYALDARTGAVRWEREAFRGRPPVRRHLKSSQANATPVTDGRRVIVLFGTVGRLAAYDFSGRELWTRDVGVIECNDPQSGSAQWGHASSPILYRDLVIIQADRIKDSFLAAFEAATGKPVWRVARDEPSTWATPNVLPAAGGDELVTNGQTIRGYDPATGRLLWTLGPNSEVVVGTPVIAEGLAIVTGGYPPVRPVYAVRPGHRGEVRSPADGPAPPPLAWRHARGGTYIPTPIAYRGHLYTVNNNGIVTCYRLDTGEQVYQTRLPGSSFSASPVAADGRLYFASETGEVYVLRAGPRFELLATNTVDEVTMATPAISDGLMVVRTLGHVIGFAAP
jgi:outer membrane protein assembly factor BamB